MAGELDSRPFSFGRLGEVRDFVLRAWHHLGPRAVLHYGDLHWLIPRGRPYFAAERDLRVWHDAGGEVTGLAWFDDAASGELMAIDLSEPLLGSMLEWLESTQLASEWARDSQHFSVQAWTDDTGLARSLAARGYQPATNVGHRLLQEIRETTEDRPPAGFSFERPSSPEMFDARLDSVLRSAFGSSDTPRPELWRSLRQLGGYRDDLAILLVDAAGEPIAAAVCWYDEPNRCGEFEPVGVMAGRQGAGLGKLVMAEGLRRLAAAGAQTAVVGVEAENTAAIRLYQAAGFEIVGTRQSFRRADLGPRSPLPQRRERGRG